MSIYDSIPTSELQSEFSDRYKEVNGFRPDLADYTRVNMIHELKGYDKAEDFDEEALYESYVDSVCERQGYNAEY